MDKSNWKNYLKGDPTEWLLEGSDPSVRYFTLRYILDLQESNPKVKDARSQIMTSVPVLGILEKQNAGGYWGKAADFYLRSKYKGTVWNLIVLAELGADNRDPRIGEAAQFILANSQDIMSGGFAYQSQGNGGEHNFVIPCLSGNMAWSLLRLGFGDDPCVQQGIAWLVEHGRCDDRIEKAPSGWPYDYFVRCWGRHSCHMGVIKILNALAEIPEKSRSPAARDFINKAAEYFLQHHIFKRSHNPGKIAKEEWITFGFPLMYKTDALEILETLGKLGYQDNRMQEGVDLVVSKQDSAGRWLLEKSFNGRMLVNIEKKNQPSKWITLKALRVIKGYYGR